MRRLVVFLILFSAGFPAAVAFATAADTLTEADDDPAAAELREHHRHHHLGGVTRFIAMSLDTLGVDDAKRPKVEMVRHALNRCMVPAGDAEGRLHLLLANGVAAGAFSTAKVDAAIEELANAASAVYDCSKSALDELHTILSPDERWALADKVESHWEVWRQVNDTAQPGGREPHGRLAALSRELSLTPEQEEKISVALRSKLGNLASQFDREKAEADIEAFSKKFVADPFDARSLVPSGSALIASHGAKRMALFYETVAPLLTPEQRATLAAHLREHASQQPTATNP